MKIYHTETQEDYDALMVELEAEGKNWWTGKKATENDIWNRFKSLTCVFVGKNINGFCYKEFYKEIAPDAPIIKYKAKADTSVKFTKENVEGLVNKYFDDNVGECPGNLIAEIYAMDDTPEKVVVPKCFDEWYSEIKNRFRYKESGKKYALWKINQFGFGYWLQDVNGENIDKEAEVSKWVSSNTMIAIDAILNGYTIEKEVLYYIPLPNLKTTDGIQQVLTKRSKNGKHYFASRPNEKLKQRYTKAEIEQVPEVYKPYAKLIEGEEQ